MCCTSAFAQAFFTVHHQRHCPMWSVRRARPKASIEDTAPTNPSTQHRIIRKHHHHQHPLSWQIRGYRNIEEVPQAGTAARCSIVRMHISSTDAAALAQRTHATPPIAFRKSKRSLAPPCRPRSAAHGTANTRPDLPIASACPRRKQRRTPSHSSSARSPERRAQPPVGCRPGHRRLGALRNHTP